MRKSTRNILLAVLALAALRLEGERCKHSESSSYAWISVDSQVYVVSIGEELCLDRWMLQSHEFRRWFSMPTGANGPIVAVHFQSPRDIEMLTNDKPGVYSLTLLHVGTMPEQTFVRHLWTLDIGDMTSAAHPFGSDRWFLPTSSGGVVVANGRVECSVRTNYANGPPADSAIGNGDVMVVAGHSLWRYRPSCGKSADVDHKRMALTVKKIAAFGEQWLAVGSDGTRSSLYVIDDKLRFIGKADLGPSSAGIDLTSSDDGVVASMPSSGVAYVYGQDGLRKMRVGRGFVVARSASTRSSVIFSDGTTVQAPTAVNRQALSDIREVTLGRTTFVMTTSDFRTRLLLSLMLIAILVGAGAYSLWHRRL